MPWVPQPDGSTLCEEHGTSWDAADPSCSSCSVGSFAPPRDRSDAERMHDLAAEMGLPTELQHERQALLDYELARRWAKRAMKAGEFGAAQRFLDTAGKFRRDAINLCAAREDWWRTYDRASRRLRHQERRLSQRSSASSGEVQN